MTIKAQHRPGRGTGRKLVVVLVLVAVVIAFYITSFLVMGR